MTREEAIKVLKSTSVNLGRRGGRTAYAEALEMAITALQAQDKLQDIEYMCRLSGGADYFNAFRAISEKVKNTTTFLNNLNDGVENSTATQSNGIESKVKGMTACRVPEGDTISRQAVINAIKNTDVCMAWNGEISAEDAADIAVRATKSSVIDSVEDLPSAQPEITPDGTLQVSINADVTKVGRILLSQTGTQRGGLYYKDALPERCEECENFSKTRLLIPQPEIIRCRDCKYGEQDDDGWWYCRSFGCQVGEEDGSGFCANAERKSGD